jgi:hypothetical protein
LLLANETDLIIVKVISSTLPVFLGHPIKPIKKKVPATLEGETRDIRTRGIISRVFIAAQPPHSLVKLRVILIR